jgi:hypothetical protein
MLDFVAATNVDEEVDPDMEVVGATKDDDLEAADGKQTRKRGLLKYYGRQQQLELVLAAQELSELRDRSNRIGKGGRLWFGNKGH